jgi:hypothetical protein
VRFGAAVSAGLATEQLAAQRRDLHDGLDHERAAADLELLLRSAM